MARWSKEKLWFGWNRDSGLIITLLHSHVVRDLLVFRFWNVKCLLKKIFKNLRIWPKTEMCNIWRLKQGDGALDKPYTFFHSKYLHCDFCMWLYLTISTPTVTRWMYRGHVGCRRSAVATACSFLQSPGLHAYGVPS